MKRDQHEDKGSAPAGVPTAKPSADKPLDGQRLQRKRWWLFRLLMVTVWPLIAFALLELVLRGIGFGHPTSFFVRKQLDGKSMLVENARFGISFFPPALARSPSPTLLASEKPAGLYRIFLFGESAALGDPRPAYGVGRYLEVLLRERFPDLRVEVICVAMTAINSHAILPIARECAGHQGDLWIVYMGNNEFFGPFGASTVFGPQAPATTWVRVYLALQRTRVGQLLLALATRLNSKRETPSNWGGMKMFLDQQMPPNDPRKERIYQNFSENLADILRAGRKAGVPIILSSVACNLKDCAPFASLHGSNVAGSGIGAWESEYAAGITNAERGEMEQAMRHFQAAAELSPEFAEGQFRLGECLLGITNIEAARPAFGRARDLDSLPFRADAKINGIIAEAARRSSDPGVTYLDAQQALAATVPYGIPGRETFYEHVHLTFDGNYRLARALAAKVAAFLPEAVLGNQKGDWPGPGVCAERLGLTDWNRRTALEEIARRVAEAPFTQQATHRRQVEELTADMAACSRRMQPSAVTDARALYENALRKTPRDHWLHHNYAEFLLAIGDLAGATKQMEIVREIVPQNHAAYLQLGRLLARQHKFGEARQRLEEALALRPDVADVYLELGQVLSQQGELDEALTQYAAARPLYPNVARICLLEAEILNKQNKRGEAIERVREAIHLRPAYWEAYERLGMELALDGDFAGARAQFDQVVRLRPDYADGHLNLGIALARLGRFEEALAEFQNTLRLEPRNARAREFITMIEQMKSRSDGP